jgi:hypothetical protein
MRVAAACGLLLAALAGFAVAARTPSKGHSMVTTAEVALMLQRQGDRLFEGTSATFTQLELSVARTDFRGIAIAAPAQVQTDSKSSVPVVVMMQQTVLRAWEVPDQYNLMLAVTDLQSGTVRAGRALHDPKDEEAAGRKPAVRPPKPTGLAASGIATKVRRLDVRVSPNQSGALAIVAIAFDVASNTATVDLTGSKPRAPGAAAAILPRPDPGPGLPSYAPASRMPQPPRTGVAFAIESSAGAGIVLRGAFSKVLALHEELPVPQNVRDNGIDRQTSAVVPLTIAVLGLEWKAPQLHPLAVPVYGAAGVTPGQNVTGQFATVIPALPAGQYVAYVFMEGVPYGPQKLQVQ